MVHENGGIFPNIQRGAEALCRKPGRYTGGEPGSIYKDKNKVDVRMAFCFPDTYEIGMSFLGKRSSTICSTGTKTGGVSAPLCHGRI